MAIVEMRQLRLLAMAEDRQALLQLLQGLGCVEVTDLTLASPGEGGSEDAAAHLLARMVPPDSQALAGAQTRRQEAERAV